MVSKIKKRDGRIVPFEREKIFLAIYKSAQAVGGHDQEIARKLAEEVCKIIDEKYQESIPDVEAVQDIVEKTLVEHGHYKTAKAYILYREQHKQIREVSFILTSEELIQDYLENLDWRIKENSNMAYSLQGLNNHITNMVTQKFWLNSIYPGEIRRAYEKGDFHVHDLGILAPYCCGWDLKDLLIKGFGGVGGKVESKPPKHLRTAVSQIVNFIYTLQGEAAGAQALSNFDSLLAPYVRYDNLSYKDVKQCMQEFVFGMNVPTRVGFQTPFSNITMDLKVPEYMKGEYVLIGGKPQKETYGEFQKEMDMINEAFAEVMSEGDAKGRIFTFPIPTYNITKDFDWENPVHNKIWEMTAKYGIPYFSNFINSDMKPEDARSMCLSGDEEIVIRNKGKIERTTIKELVETYGGDDWNECNENIEVMSLNDDYKIEWIRIKNFLKTRLQGTVKIKTKDGKFCKFSGNHPIIVLNEAGLKQKMAKEIKIGDYMISLKDSGDCLAKDNEKLGNWVLDEKLAFLMGFFTADGNFLYDSIKEESKLRGLQFTFDSRNIVLREEIKKVIKEKFNYEAKEKKDPRYNTYYLYVYNSEIASLIYNSGFKKYGRVSNLVFNSPKKIIENFLEGFFAGDGYEKRKEIHIRDGLLIRDLSILYSLVGIPNILKIREKSQRLYLQHKLSTENIKQQPVNCLYDLVPGFLAKSTYVVPGLNKGRMVGQATLMKYNAETELSIKLKNSNVYPVSVVEIEKTENIEDFYDIELEKNHKFVHSLGTITNNCCRLRLDNRELRKRGGGLFGANPLTGSIGVVTMNLPRIGYLSQSEDEFLRRLGTLMDLAMESLEIKRKVVEKFTELGLYPYAKHFLGNIKLRFGSYWKNHFSTIGIIGMNEAMINFLGFDLTNKDARAFALRILDFMRDRISYYQDMTGHLYNLEATPGEGTSYSLARKDKKMYPAIRAANEDDVIAKGAAPYYTNSTQLPVHMTDDIFEALDLQDEFQTKYTGGTVLHGFIGEKIPNVEAVKTLVKKIASNYHLPYFTLTPTFSICPIHGYMAGEHEYCPKCEEIPDVNQEIKQETGEKKV